MRTRIMHKFEPKLKVTYDWLVKPQMDRAPATPGRGGYGLAFKVSVAMFAEGPREVKNHEQ